MRASALKSLIKTTDLEDDLKMNLCVENPSISKDRSKASVAIIDAVAAIPLYVEASSHSSVDSAIHGGLLFAHEASI